jgi:hypothetical protein
MKHPPGAYDQIFITVRQMRICWWGALSLTRGRVCCSQLLLTLASAVIFGSESCGTSDHTRILLSHVWDFHFRRLVWLALLQWKYSTPPPHRIAILESKSHCDWRSVSQSVSQCVEPRLGLMTRYYYCLTVTVLFLWGAHSDERTGLSFVYAAGPCQRAILDAVGSPYIDWALTQ